ncbi:uncharacterized protein LOC109012252 [Juglans regia]|uniref:Uncharacterized protein LOC109012252 n=2 Tax=Juglans regia TaxID=51240 RepID=A0A2I4GZJ7_JUGRE|nr:uncharacterized protein LOC109012252 [Juglans regia]
MEAAKEREAGLLHQILPPRIEDAGLEDCALPPDSIKEAFLKAATAVKSRAASIFTTSDDEETVTSFSEGDCVKDPWPSAAKGTQDTVVAASPEHEAPGPCATDKGSGVPGVGGDDAVVVGGESDVEERGDKVVVGVEEIAGTEGKACVEGLEGLEIGDKVKNGEGDDERGDEKKPTLTEGFA